MNDVAPAKSKLWIDPVKEAKAVAAIREALRQVGEADDETLLLDSIEGQTQLFEIIDTVLERMTEAEAMVAGLELLERKLAERRRRFEKRITSDRTALEQALTIAELPNVERPSATLYIADRPASLSVTEESDIPASYWKTGDPTLDRKKLTADLKARAKALATLPADPEERAAAIAAVPPEIPGATLNNGAPSLTIRRA